MRFHLGKIPEDPHFHPQDEGWTPMKEPNPLLLQVLALPFAVLAGAGLMIAWGPLLLTWRGDVASTAWLAVLFILVIPAHELIHALVHPGQGRRSTSILGFWPSRLLFYAHFEGTLTRNRFAMILMMPFLVISVAPIPVFRLLGQAPGWVMWLSIWNGVLSCGDLFGFTLLLSQVPGRAWVQNLGYATWWKLPESRGD